MTATGIEPCILALKVPCPDQLDEAALTILQIQVSVTTHCCNICSQQEITVPERIQAEDSNKQVSSIPILFFLQFPLRKSDSNRYSLAYEASVLPIHAIPQNQNASSGIRTHNLPGDSRTD